MIWWAIIGSTEQALLNKVESTLHTLDSGFLQGHVSRLSHARRGDGNENQKSTMKITYEKEYPFSKYYTFWFLSQIYVSRLFSLH